MTSSLPSRVRSVLDETVGSGAGTGLQAAVRARTGREATPETPFFSFSARGVAAMNAAFKGTDRVTAKGTAHGNCG